MIVAVTGGRDYQPVRKHIDRFDAILYANRPQIFRHGGARGADTLAARLAIAHARKYGVRWRGRCCYIECWQANWDKYGRAAGAIRNRHMLVGSTNASRSAWILADLLVAFPGGRGTDSCVTIARELGIVVVLLDDDHYDWDSLFRSMSA